MTGDEMKELAREVAREAVRESGGVVHKRKKARASVPYRAPATSPATERLDRALKLTDRATRQINGNLFKLEPDVPVHRDDLEGEFTSDSLKEQKTREKPDLWAQVFMEDRLTLEDLLPYRIRVAWRFCRELARLKGLIADDEGLEEILAITPDPWVEPHGYTVNDKSMFSRLNADIAQKLVNISLLPPEAPPNASRENYDPNRDVVLGVYMDTIHFLSLYLQVRRGSVLDPAQGRYGLYGLEDPSLLRLAFPSRLQILAWEELIVEETFKSMAQDGQSATEEFLHHTYGLMQFEILSLIKLAKGKARKRLENDLEEDRAIMVFRLEEVARRAKNGLDLRVELGALKQMSLVMGLGRTDPEDSLKDFIDVVDRVSKAARPKEIEGTVEARIEAPRLIDG